MAVAPRARLGGGGVELGGGHRLEVEPAALRRIWMATQGNHYAMEPRDRSEVLADWRVVSCCTMGAVVVVSVRAHFVLESA
jgi:hypothetical protein